MNPKHSSVVIPRLVCRDPSAAIDSCVRLFGTNGLSRRPGPDGGTAHALLTLGATMPSIEAERPTLPGRAPALDGSSPVAIFVYVEDVDAAFARAVEPRARAVVPAQDQLWGDRIAWAADPHRQVWTIATRVEEATADERDRSWSTILAEPRGAE